MNHRTLIERGATAAVLAWVALALAAVGLLAVMHVDDRYGVESDHAIGRAIDRKQDRCFVIERPAPVPFDAAPARDEERLIGRAEENRAAVARVLRGQRAQLGWERAVLNEVCE